VTDVSPRQAKRLRERAIQYAEHGWPVAPLVVPVDSADAPRRVGDPAYGRADVEAIWAGRNWGIALCAEHFEVMELPPEYGALLNQQLRTTCPTAMAPVHRRWWFFLERGSVTPTQVEAVGGVLHREWVPAPGTRQESTGRIRWLVHPMLTHWRSYRRQDPIALVLDG
jgi:hypothetical protein